MNKKDSERIEGMIRDEFDIVESAEDADTVILVTCAVREKPERKVYSEAQRLKGLGKKVGIVGCVAQLRGKDIFEKKLANFVVSTTNIHRIKEALRRVEMGEGIVAITGINLGSERFISPPPPCNVKAYVTIQEGCNQFCTYCVVPMARGKEITRPSEDIIREAKELAERGVKEIILLGQNVNGYGRANPNEISFPNLLRRINEIPGILRIRFISSNPLYVDEDFIFAMKLEKVCEHLHLPVQSGSDKVLRLMGRRYSQTQYLDTVKRLKDNIPEIALTTDIIVGFPGETEEDFEKTVSLLEEVQFDDIFSFKFSKRPGTFSETLEDNVPEDEKLRRLKIIQNLQNQITLRKMKEHIGKLVEVLVEGPSKRSEKDLTGRTRQNKIVNFPCSEELIGKLAIVKIENTWRNSLRGKIWRESWSQEERVS